MTDENPISSIAPLRKPVRCPQCGKQSLRLRYPFCSKRCAELDLGAWFSGRYAIATGIVVGEADSSLTES